MKTQKRFGIFGMFKTLKFLGICLLLAALFASGTQAATTITIDPGTPGEGAQDFDFGSVSTEDPLRVLFTDNKTIEWDAGAHFWQSPGQPPGLSYLGFFLDENLDPITTAAFAGRTASGGGDLDLPIAFASLAQDGVFRGMLFIDISGSDAADFDWVWNPDDRPTVGVVPIPAAVWLLGGGLIGLVRLRRKFNN